MSYLDSASLLMIPSGYKEDKVFCQLPEDGSGDLTFTRASDGTRVNSEGYVERVPWNLLQYSEQFDNAAWSKVRSSITANALTSPDGYQNADKITEDSSNNSHFAIDSIVVSNSTSYTFSVFAKAAERGWVALYNNFTGTNTFFDLNNGELGSVGSGSTAKIEEYGSGWYRCSITFTSTSTSYSAAITICTANNTASYQGDGTSGIYIWGAQLTEGPTAKPYIATTNRQDVPRLDYSNGCPCLLLEPQRTNLVTHSEYFAGGGWANVGSTITSNATTSPSGNNDATLIVSSSGGSSRVQDYFGALSGNHSYSLFVKAYTTSTRLNIATNDNGSLVLTIPTSGTPIVYSQGSANTSYFITELSNGWYRVGFTFLPSGATNYFQIYPDASAQGGGVYVWGAQCEAGSYPTSYIPTTSASVTRLADSCYKTGVADWIGQSEGVLFVDYQTTNNGGNGERIMAISNGTAANRIVLFDQLGKIRVYTATGSAVQWDITTAINTNGHHKIAVGYKANDAVLYIDGAQITTDASYLVPACSAVYIGTSEAYGTSLAGNINKALLFKTRLTNDQLADLTTL